MSDRREGDYFQSSPWRDVPVEVGHLGTDNYDPTYGGGHVGLGAAVYECLACGALVLNHQLHIAWHENIAKGGDA